MSIVTSKLLIKNMPCSMDEFAQLIQELKLIIPRSLNSFGRKRAVIEYASAEEAQHALQQLMGLAEILDKPLCVTTFGPRANDGNTPKSANKSTQASAAPTRRQDSISGQDINKYVQNLIARNSQYDFAQAPPPYLRYAYPPANDDILRRIADTLKNDKRFYWQVLHLMNRMNLAPPFGERPKGVILPPQMSNSVATQTEWPESESESELESEEDHMKRQPSHHAEALKRPANNILLERYKKRARKILQVTKNRPVTASGTAEKFDVPELIRRKIELKLPKVLPEVPQLPTERLSSEQLQELAVYKNYKVGEPSNKLYIKNLDKSVTESHLRKLYERFAPTESLEIKVMQQGRMKGQAFVTFQNLNDPAEDADAAAMVAKALDETNGMLWQQKPMIVCYGKQTQQQQQ